MVSAAGCLTVPSEFGVAARAPVGAAATFEFAAVFGLAVELDEAPDDATELDVAPGVTELGDPGDEDGPPTADEAEIGADPVCGTEVPPGIEGATGPLPVWFAASGVEVVGFEFDCARSPPVDVLDAEGVELLSVAPRCAPVLLSPVGDTVALSPVGDPVGLPLWVPVALSAVGDPDELSPASDPLELPLWVPVALSADGDPDELSPAKDPVGLPDPLSPAKDPAEFPDVLGAPASTPEAGLLCPGPAFVAPEPLLLEPLSLKPESLAFEPESLEATGPAGVPGAGAALAPELLAPLFESAGAAVSAPLVAVASAALAALVGVPVSPLVPAPLVPAPLVPAPLVPAPLVPVPLVPVPLVPVPLVPVPLLSAGAVDGELPSAVGPFPD